MVFLLSLETQCIFISHVHHLVLLFEPISSSFFSLFVSFGIYFKFILEEEKKLKSPGYQRWLKEQKELEEFAEEEEKRVRNEREKKWIEDEKMAQEKWKKEQEWIKKEALRRARKEVSN